ncbi:hypothetical protein RRG08_016718 [Elysia crispata]|uniref:Uncharacterized protein n=1 Tax=Elysia crispata TaxID=231223 RepID=A0AAE1B3F2_9GAST|nr:hypothetical protein RRG08_016718 [Elysia crispata]
MLLGQRSLINLGLAHVEQAAPIFLNLFNNAGPISTQSRPTRFYIIVINWPRLGQILQGTVNAEGRFILPASRVPGLCSQLAGVCNVYRIISLLSVMDVLPLPTRTS